jgi:eukaryotic-like serine/threonine-protein kinase
MSPAINPVRVGERLGPYRIEGLLGAGGMGHVYLALDTRLHRTVAIKFAAGSPQTRDALWQEARLAAALNHPAICIVHEIGQCGDTPYLVMEHIRGTTLASLLVASGVLAVGRAIDLARQVSDAVAHAHDRGVVHGDIKSSNVMVAADGGVKVLDFGVGVRQLPEATAGGEETTSPTPSNSGAGTVPYMAPELLRGQIPDVQSDVWALGVLLHEMLTGSRPFRGTTPYETAAQILGNERVAGSVPVPSALRGVVDRCLSERPCERFSARDLGCTLRELHGDLRALEKPVSWTSMQFVTALSRGGR